MERPSFLEGFVPRWWWWKRCRRNILVVTDGFLDFGLGGFGLSEFLTAFNQLEAQSWIDYRVTTAHRQSGTQSNNPVVVQHHNNFRFDQTNLGSFDQIWIFGANAGALAPTEVNAIEVFMDGGGGVFATGDHGALGQAMGGSIPRVQDMRYWNDFGVNEVGMSQARRNDTNRPEPGSSISHFFDNQSDSTPQNVAVRTFGSGYPHPLLSISPNLRPSRIIDIMPDHPHEGECKPETTFKVNNVNVPTQIIATSFVGAGSTAAGKVPTDPHCFPSIAVWDGWKDNAGRIVVDSTWHHFVNINLNGAGSAQTGLNPSDWVVICQYYMNISLWMSRRRIWWCWWRRLLFELVSDSQVVEASVEVAVSGPSEAPLSDLHSIGSLAEELLGSRFNPGYARGFLLELLGNGASPNIASMLENWSPTTPTRQDDTPARALDLDGVFHIAVGAGLAAVRSDERFADTVEGDEDVLEAIEGLFNEGLQVGLERAVEDLRNEIDWTMSAVAE